MRKSPKVKQCVRVGLIEMLFKKINCIKNDKTFFL